VERGAGSVGPSPWGVRVGREGRHETARLPGRTSSRRKYPRQKEGTKGLLGRRFVGRRTREQYAHRGGPTGLPTERTVKP